MGIYDVGYGGFGAFQSDYRINNIPKADDLQKVTPVKETEPVKKSEARPLVEEIDTRPRATDPNSISLTFDKNSEFSSIGRDMDIELLDMEKAISTMKQDSLFQEYQYFVGSSNNVFSSEDGMVIAKLN